MNVFEDLIEELKEEKLLESTVIENTQTENYFQTSQPQAKPNPSPRAENSSLNQLIENDSLVAEINESSPVLPAEDSDEFEIPTETLALKNENFVNEKLVTEELVENLSKETLSFADQIVQEETALQSLQSAIGESANLENEEPEFPEYELLSKKVVEDNEFYRRRANEEVTSLQIVEHIITAIEKEQMKIVPQSYDDLSVSMSLHDFLQSGTDPLSDEHTQAEFKLMQETEKWYSALAARDRNITVGDLRRYCENARPALSSQALISLARFYRNSPFSEAVRSKFDMVVTRLVSKDSWDDTRLMLFNRDELVKQLEELYADWSSIPLYEHKEEDSDVLIGVLKFDDFILEANNADSLEELIRSDFFNRIREFKETTNEKFFAPLLASAAVECNVIVGNKYVQLIGKEKENRSSAEMEEKYNFVLDQPVSDTVSKTLKLVEILKEKKEPPKPVAVEQPKEIKEELIVEKSSKAINVENDKKKKVSKFKINKWLAAVVVVALLALGGLYSWGEFMTPQLKTAPNVRKVILEGTPFREYFKEARVNRETYFAISEAAWEKLSNEVKEDVLKKLIAEGTNGGYNRIHVLNGEGKMVAFASEKQINLNP
jgi:hypothetical protein